MAASRRCLRKCALAYFRAPAEAYTITGLSVASAASMIARTCSRLLTLKAGTRSRAPQHGRAVLSVIRAISVSIYGSFRLSSIDALRLCHGATGAFHRSMAPIP